MFYHIFRLNRKETKKQYTLFKKQRIFFSLAFTLLNVFQVEPRVAEAVA